MKTLKQIEVYMDERKVGTLGTMKHNLVAFQYDQKWIQEGFSISPFSLPLEETVFVPKIDPFDGVFGVFFDSLPDGWGRLLVDRLLLGERIDPSVVNNLNRLAMVGDSGMGALSYHPIYEINRERNVIDFDKIAEECEKILENKLPEDLDELFQLGGSSGGARPKVLTEVDGEDWIIKFPSTNDVKDIGVMEFAYAQCARKCGVEMSETQLFPSQRCHGYFGTKRFDRCMGARKIHMISVNALLETSHRIPNLDYHILMKLTMKLTNSFVEIEKLYRLMCFNVFAHNRDDHSKNFSFLYDQEREQWILSPAYDLTYSNSIGGEHATCVNGNGRNPGMKDILEVAKLIGFNKKQAQNIANEISEIVKHDLREYLI